MRDLNQPDRRRATETLAGRALLLLFGIGVLGFLIAIDRAEWFAIRPATGTSLAMSKASAAGIARPGFAAKSHDESSTSHP